MQIFGAPWFEAAQAVGTLAAVLVALTVAIVELYRARAAEKVARQLQEERVSEQRLTKVAQVSAWVETAYESSRDGSHYVGTSTVYLANPGDSPVFEVEVSIGLGSPAVRLGPLAVPMPVPVLPPRRTMSWDISTGLLAHRRNADFSTGIATAEALFTDVDGGRWKRDFDGRLSPQMAGEAPDGLGVDESQYAEETERQLGNMDDPLNPIPVVLALVSLLAGDLDDREVIRQLPALVDTNAPGWKGVTPDQLSEMREDVQHYGLATHVWYPAPRVAWVRLLHEQDVAGIGPVAPGTSIRVMAVTLVLRDNHWVVFSIGGEVSQPDFILFPRGTLQKGIRG